MSDPKSKNPYPGFKPLNLEITEKDKFNFQEKAENIVISIINPFFQKKKGELEKLKSDYANKKKDEEIIQSDIDNNYFTKNNTLLINGPSGSGKTRLGYEITKFIKTGKLNTEPTSINTASMTWYKLKKGINKNILKKVDSVFTSVNSNKQIKKLKAYKPQDKNSISVLNYSLTDFNYYKDYHANLLVSIFENLGGHTILDTTLKFISKSVLGTIDEALKKVFYTNHNPLEEIKNFLFKKEDHKYVEASYSKVKRVSRYINLLTLEKPLVIILDGLDTLKPVDMEKLFLILNHVFSSLPNIFFILPCNYDYINTVLQINKAKENYTSNLFSFKVNTKYFLKSEELSIFENEFINKLILCSTKFNLGMFEKNYLITQRALDTYLQENTNLQISKPTLEFIFCLLAYLKYNFESWYLNILKLSELDFLLLNNLENKLLNSWKKDLLALENKETSHSNEEEYQTMIFEAIVSSLIKEKTNNKLIIKTETKNYISLFYFYLIMLNEPYKLEFDDYEIAHIDNNNQIKITIKNSFFLKKPEWSNFNFVIFQELIKVFIINNNIELNLELITSLMQISIYKL